MIFMEKIFDWLDEKLPIIIIPLCVIMFIRIFYQIITN